MKSNQFRFQHAHPELVVAAIAGRKLDLIHQVMAKCRARPLDQQRLCMKIASLDPQLFVTRQESDAKRLSVRTKLEDLNPKRIAADLTDPLWPGR